MLVSNPRKSHSQETLASDQWPQLKSDTPPPKRSASLTQRANDAATAGERLKRGGRVLSAGSLQDPSAILHPVTTTSSTASTPQLHSGSTPHPITTTTTTTTSTNSTPNPGSSPQLSTSTNSTPSGSPYRSSTHQFPRRLPQLDLTSLAPEQKQEVSEVRTGWQEGGMAKEGGVEKEGGRGKESVPPNIKDLSHKIHG